MEQSATEQAAAAAAMAATIAAAGHNGSRTVIAHRGAGAAMATTMPAEQTAKQSAAAAAAVAVAISTAATTATRCYNRSATLATIATTTPSMFNRIPTTAQRHHHHNAVHSNSSIHSMCRLPRNVRGNKIWARNSLTTTLPPPLYGPPIRKAKSPVVKANRLWWMVKLVKLIVNSKLG
jgi:hypothetical protein